MNGAGNDFVMIDKRDLGDYTLSAEEVISVCDRRRGIGSDGMIVIQPSQTADFEMIYYNSDGKPGSLCGNGARCAVKFARQQGYFGNNLTNFEVGGKKFSGEYYNDNLMGFHTGPPEKIKLNFKIKAFGQLITSHYANTGSPHVVIEIGNILEDPGKPDSGFTNLEKVPVLDIGKEIRYSRDFSPGGVNVNFISRIGNDVFIRTYERGVENETLACGTGSIAAALVLNSKYGIQSPVNLKTAGGDTLNVEFSNNAGTYSGINLTGPAKINFTGIFNII